MLEQQYVLVLLLRLAVAASFASILTRFGAFQRLLMREERTLLQRVNFGLCCSAMYGAGVAARVLVPAYQAVDLGLEGSFLTGLVGGYVSGLISGILISIPAVGHKELMSMPLFAAIGVLGGLLRDVAQEPEEIWRFSPFLDLRIYRIIRGGQNWSRTLFQFGCLATIILCELLRLSVATLFKPRGVFCLAQQWPHASALTTVGLYGSAAFAVILPLKIWNATRTERKLETQQRLLDQARLAALTRQINPHFLFNTLNSVSSLIRTSPEQARNVVYRLSSILRVLLRNAENFTPLRDELSFVDNYLAIEMARFGEHLRFEKDIAPDTLDQLVPSMLIQPIVENSVKHGLSKKVGGGMIRIATRMSEGWLHMVIEDDGLGIPETKLATLFNEGIGVSNVNERLKVLFGTNYRMWIDSKPGEGTRTGIEIPVQRRETGTPESVRAAG